MTLLIEMARGSLHCLLPDDRDAASWHPALTAEVAAHLTPAHALILARPVPGGETIAWEADAAQVRRAADLPPADRDALMRAVRVILSDIRRLAESGRAPSVSRCWPALREVPDLGMLHAADGRPVLAGWGFVPQGVTAPRLLLADADDGRAWRAPARTPWLVYGAALGALALLAFAAGLLLPRFAIPHSAAAACAPAPGDLDALNAQAQADARHGALQAELARLVEEQGGRRLRCPLPAAAPVPPPPPQRAEVQPPPPQPAPPPPEPPPVPLPREAWDKHDLSILEGCWHRISNMAVYQEATGRTLPVSNWRICFDRNGHGTQAITLENGGTCRGGLQATFEGPQMVTRAGRCTGPGFDAGFVRSEQRCTRVSDEEADCIARDLEGAGAGRGTSRSRFRR